MVESVGTVQAIFTAESNPDNEKEMIVTYWLTNGVKIGSMNVQKGQ